MTDSRPPGSPRRSVLPTNEVRLRGRVTTAPEDRVLPSGTPIVTLRISVSRERSPMTDGSRQSADWVDCSVWGRRMRHVVSGWRREDVVEVEGALRRRFQRGDAGTLTRLEVEVLGGRLVTRAGPSPPAADAARRRGPV